MVPPNIKRRNTELQLESVAKLSSIPIVESSIYIAGSVYEKIKRSNPLMGWGLDTAEQSLAMATSMATATALPAMIAFNLPIMTIDQLLCKGIDIVEQRVPVVTLPPHLMYWNTREYVNNKFVKPVLIRADSVKLIGSQAANAAVERLAGAINVADQYVDHYLPPDPADKIVEITDSTKSAETSKAARTIEHGARFSRKLQRRLTRRTLAEARALKEQGTECIHVLLYVVELLATDPKLAMQKAQELWASLSLPEPENQARPTNLEQLLVLCTRESARRIVHLVNGTAALASRAPRRLARTLIRISHSLVSISEQALKVINESIFRFIAKVFVTMTSLGFHHHHHYHHHSVENQSAKEKISSSQENLIIHSKHKLHFQTKDNYGNNSSCGGSGGSGGSISNAGTRITDDMEGSIGNYLSLIAKINIVPLSRLPTKLSSSSIIEEFNTEINDNEKKNNSDCYEIQNKNSNVVDSNAGDKSLLSFKGNKFNNSVYKSRKLPVKSSFGYTGDSVLPLRTNRSIDKRNPCPTKIKPVSSVRQKI